MQFKYNINHFGFDGYSSEEKGDDCFSVHIRTVQCGDGRIGRAERFSIGYQSDSSTRQVLLGEDGVNKEIARLEKIVTGLKEATAEAKRKMNEINGTDKDKSKERIICAAIWVKHNDLKVAPVYQPINIPCGMVVGGYRHHNIIGVLDALGIEGIAEAEQGFLTTHNRFVDRKEARAIWLKQDSNNTCAHPTELFSEDLY